MLVVSLPSLRFLWLFLAALLSACSFMAEPILQKPDIQLRDIRLKNATLLEQEFIIDFSVKNPNSFELPVRALNYRIQLNELELFKGNSVQDFIVPAKSSTTFSVTVHCNLWRHLRNLRQVLNDPHQPVRYQLNSEIKTGLFFGERIALKRVGEFIPSSVSNR